MPSKKYLYLDYAAATPVAPAVLRAMQPYWREVFGNPSSLHRAGQKARDALERCKKTIAALLGGLPDEFIFTSGGTESINLALKGLIDAHNTKDHLISTTIEHHATLATLHTLKKNGHEVTLIPCDTSGRVSADAVVAAIGPRTTIISMILVQNEIGTIQPVAEVGKRLLAINRERTQNHEPQIFLHVDACQAPAILEINLPRLHADLVSLDASKIYGPKGIGLLYIRRGITVNAQIDGGGQQYLLRSGTEPLALIAGLTAALEYVATQRNEFVAKASKLRDYLIQRITAEIPETIVTGHRTERAAHIASFVFSHVEGESIVFHLDRAGIAASTGSACSTPDLKPSPIIAALQLPGRFRKGSLRLSLGYGITKKEIDAVVSKLTKIISNLRK